MKTNQVNKVVSGIMHMSIILGIFMVLHGTAFGQVTRASDIPLTRSEQVLNSTNRAQILSIMREEGYSAHVMILDGDEDPEMLTLRLLIWRVDGYTTTVIIAEDGLSVMFRAVVSSSRVRMNAVNEWNREHKYSRSYLDRDGDPVIEMDLNMRGGVTLERVKSYFQTCHRSFREWSRTVLD